MAKNMILFDHLPKTGGTSLTEVLANLCGVSYTMDGTHRNHSAEIRRKNRKSFLSGHFWFSIGDRLDPETYYATVLRDPTDRFLSQYFFSRNDSKGHGDHAAISAKRLNLDEYVSSAEQALVRSYSNVQAYHFAALTLSYDTTQVADKLLYQAALDVLQQYDLVGIFEDLYGFIDVFCKDWGFVPPESLPTRNITSQRLRSDEISSSILAKLKSANEVDRELYAWAQSAFHARYRKTIVSIFKSRSANLVEAGDSAAINAGTPNEPTAVMQNMRIEFGNRRICIRGIQVVGDLSQSPEVLSGETVVFRLFVDAEIDCPDLVFGLSIHRVGDNLVYGTNSFHQGQSYSVVAGGSYYFDFRVRLDIGAGEYFLNVSLHTGRDHLTNCFHWVEDISRFVVTGIIGHHFEGLVHLHGSLSCGSLNQQMISINDTGVPNVFPLFVRNRGLSDFSFRIETDSAGLLAKPGEIQALNVTVHNLSKEIWPCAGTNPVCISYHIISEKGEMLVYDGQRTLLPHDLTQCESLQLPIAIIAPFDKGQYKIKIVPVQENVAWFDQYDVSALDISVYVR